MTRDSGLKTTPSPSARQETQYFTLCKGRTAQAKVRKRLVHPTKTLSCNGHSLCSTSACPTMYSFAYGRTVWRSKSSANLEYQQVLEELEGQEANPTQQPAPTPPPDSKPRGRRRNSVTTYTVDLASLGRGDSSSLVAAPPLPLPSFPASLLRTRTSVECLPLSSEPNDTDAVSSSSLTRMGTLANAESCSNPVPYPLGPHIGASGHCPAPPAWAARPAADQPSAERPQHNHVWSSEPLQSIDGADSRGRGPAATGVGSGRPGSAVWPTRLQSGSTPVSGGLPRDLVEQEGQPVAAGSCSPARAHSFHPCPPPSASAGAAAAPGSVWSGAETGAVSGSGPVAVSVSSTLAARRQANGGLTVRLPALRRGVTTEGPSPGSCTSKGMSPTAQGSPAGGCGTALHSPAGLASPGGYSPGPLSGGSVVGEGSASGRWGGSGVMGLGSRRLCGGLSTAGAGGGVQRSDSQGSWVGFGGGGDEGCERGCRVGAGGRRGSVLHVGSAEELLDVDFMEDTGRWWVGGAGCDETYRFGDGFTVRLGAGG